VSVNPHEAADNSEHNKEDMLAQDETRNSTSCHQSGPQASVNPHEAADNSEHEDASSNSRAPNLTHGTHVVGTSSTPSGPMSLSLLSLDIPSSAKATYEAVFSRWDKEWADCVNTFLTFEKAAKSTTKDNCLPVVKSRPQELGKWFKIGRKTTGSAWDNFCAGDADDFGKRWKVWWNDIQPETRKRGEDVNMDNIDWRAL